MGPSREDVEAVLNLLSGTPGHIARITRGASHRRLHQKASPDAWSAREIVAHLRACAEVWGRSIERMLEEDQPTIRYVSPRSWIRTTDFLEHDFHETLQAFSARRAGLVETLRRIRPVDWSRGATFSGTTLGRNATVMTYARRIADHEVGHLEQIRRTVGA